jgi:hypothetical protein
MGRLLVLLYARHILGKAYLGDVFITKKLVTGSCEEQTHLYSAVKGISIT